MGVPVGGEGGNGAVVGVGSGGLLQGFLRLGGSLGGLVGGRPGGFVGGGLNIGQFLAQAVHLRLEIVLRFLQIVLLHRENGGENNRHHRDQSQHDAQRLLHVASVLLVKLNAE